MRIALVQLWHADQMGYSPGYLARHMTALGHEVHLITSDCQPYATAPDYHDVYSPFLGPPHLPCGVIQHADGYVLHRLPHDMWRGQLRLKGLFATLRRLRPDVVQGFALNLPSYESAIYRPLLGYKLFLEARVHTSVFALANSWAPLRTRLSWALWKRTVGRLVSAMTCRCFPISTDCAEIAFRFYRMSRGKMQVAPLGTDPDLFRPVQTAADRQSRAALRARLGFRPDDLVCIYTGRFTRDKAPLVLAHAVVRLVAERRPFRGLFVGHGPAALVDTLRRSPGCVVHRFVPTTELPPLYRAADIAAWPRQESTSQLDAAACGLPLVLDDAVQVRERITGNGLTYRGGDSDDLADQLLTLADPALRRRMGEIGRRRMVELFDWRRLARIRVREYERALGAPAANDHAAPHAAPEDRPETVEPAEMSPPERGHREPDAQLVHSR